MVWLSGFNAGIEVLLRRGTNLLPEILPDSPWLAKVDEPLRQFPALWLRERLRPFVGAGKPDSSAQGLAWSFHVRSGDLPYRDARHQYDGRERQGHGAQWQSVVIRA